MKISKIVSASLALVLGWSGTAFAQSELDALRYSRIGVVGSARIQGIGGAQTALGADISTLSANPAGLGMFRRSEASISPGFGINTSSSTIDGITTPDERNSLGIPHAGIVFSNRKGDNEGGDWRGASFGVSFTRLNNFNSRTSYNGNRRFNPAIGDHGSMVDYFADIFNSGTRSLADLNNEGRNGYYTLEGLAYGTFLFDVYEDEEGEYAVPILLDDQAVVQQQEEILRRGSQNQIDFGVGTNYKDKLYIGASIGVVSTSLTQERLFRENFVELEVDEENNSATPYPGNLELRDVYTSRGSGVNLRVGLIYRPVDALRLGVSVQTPTLYTFSESFRTSLSAAYSGLDPVSEPGLPGEFTYSLTTPFRATGGIAYFIDKYGFITADLEFVNYGNSRFSESDLSTSGSHFVNLNSNIANTFGSVVNYRLGAEGRYEVFRFRAGFASSANPYTNTSIDGNAAANSYTLGAGIRLQNYYVDAAYVNTSMNTRYSPYVFSDGSGPVVNISDRMSNVLFTVGYNF